MHTARQALKNRGFKVTPQRLAIYEALLSTATHPTVESIYQMVSTKYPTMSLNTVYTTLNSLAKAGLARLVEAGDGFRYDGNPLPHAHIICIKCHRVNDLAAHIDHFLTKLPNEAAATSGFKVQDYAVYFYGLCPQCQMDK